MNNFLKKLWVFLILPFLIIFISDVYLRNKSSLYKEKFNGARNEAEKIEVLILGNSHANYGVDPMAFDDYAYNIANVNQSFYFDKRITLKLLDELENLKYVLISADYHSLYFSDQGLRNFWAYQGHGIKYKDDGFFLKRLSPTLFGYPPKVILSYLKRDFKNIFFYDNKGVDYPVQKGVNILDTLSQGFIGFKGTDLNSFNEDQYKARASTFNNKILNSDNDEHIEIQNDLKDLIEKLKQLNIVPILYSTPTYSEYNEYLDSVSVNKGTETYKKLASEYNIPYWDFMKSDLFNMEYFYDEDHLNKRGAHKFGSILNDSIKKIAKKRYEN
jgi:hypothetical protein